MTRREIIAERHGPYDLLRWSEVTSESIVEALVKPGEVLKSSPKAVTRRVGAWVVKEMVGSWPQQVRQMVIAGKARRAWKALCYLDERGVGVPGPVAWVRRRRLGMTTQNALVFDYLTNCVSVEAWALGQLGPTGPAIETGRFLDAVADAVNQFSATGAYHADLSGKNILTRDGQSFYFIDLDGVALGQSYTDRERLKNHIQLYDSFCDLWGDDLLEPFIGRMLPDRTRLGEWMNSVREGQRRRRARTEAIWREQGCQ